MARVCCFNVGHLMSIVSEVPVAGETLLGSVGLGGANRPLDVKIVQGLLNLTRAKWLAPAVPLNVDGLVGPKTIGAIKTFQISQFGTADSRIDPGKRTLARLNVFAVPSGGSAPQAARFTAVGVAGPAAPTAAGPAPMTPLQAGIEATPRAIVWVVAALAHLNALKAAIMAAGGDMRLILPFVMQTANTHFHFDRDPSAILVNIGFTIRVFQRITAMLADPGRYYAEGPETVKSPFADAPMGGFDLPNFRFTFRTRYPTCGPMTRSAMLVHEGAHFCGKLNEINHFAMEFPAPNGQPQDGSTRNYEQLTTSEALRNASSYAAFAIHCAFNADHRFGAADISK